MKSSATTVEQYLAELTADRRVALSAVRRVILKNLDADYEEGMQCGMIGYYVPHRVFPAGYRCDPRQPLPIAGLASQKNHMALYLMSIYVGCGPGESPNEHFRWFQKAWRKTGKKLDMGKACIRFRALDELPLDVIGEAIKRVPGAKWIEYCRSAISAAKKTETGRKVAAAKSKGGKVVEQGDRRPKKGRPILRKEGRTGKQGTVTGQRS